MPIEVDKYVKTPLPSWAEEPDYVLHGTGPYGDKVVREQLWMKRIGEGVYELRCVPMFLYGLAYGDLVTRDDGEALRVVEPSGRSAFRVFWSVPCDDREMFERQVGDRNGRVVWYSSRLVGVDAEKGKTDDL
ncbi:MAG TPA: DUF4265 domain-containing protein, partial [Fimbriimonadaceae bacterium]|nr:DUF4265 domain-containing protein [Fimbriimonadaceae bacterium]